jgi:hypothetical protein
MSELTIKELERRGVKGEGLEIRRWRQRQRLPSGRRMGLADLARLAGCTVETLSMIERGVRPGGSRLRSRLWAVVLASEADGGTLKPIAKCRPAALEPGSGAQMALPLVG